MKTTLPFWPCPNNCENLTRFFDLTKPQTNHHPRCEHVDKSLIDVWRVTYDDGGFFITDQKPEDLYDESEYIITQEKMHREIYDQLPEFEGF